MRSKHPKHTFLEHGTCSIPSHASYPEECCRRALPAQVCKASASPSSCSFPPLFVPLPVHPGPVTPSLLPASRYTAADFVGVLVCQCRAESFVQLEKLSARVIVAMLHVCSVQLGGKTCTRLSSVMQCNKYRQALKIPPQ